MANVNRINDITDFYNLSSDVIKNAAANSSTATVKPEGNFDSFL